jgi:exosortase/archaeosortase family protein
MTVSVRPAVTPAMRLAAMLGAWAIASFALMRSPHLQAWVMLPFAEWQATLVTWWFGSSALPIVMVPDCSGLDVMALCAGTIALYPVCAARRFTGAIGGLTLLLALNLLRIATLARAAGSPAFGTLHEYVWPAILTLATLGYVGAWIWRIERPRLIPDSRGTRFAVCASVLLVVYVVATAVVASAGMLDLYAADTASTAAWLLRTLGVDASVAGRVLQVRDAPYLITYECVTTPLLPIYLAAVMTAPWSRGTRLAAAAATVPLFAALGVVRLMTLAMPPVLLGSRLFLTHGFNQWLLGLLAIGLAAAVGHAPRGWRARAARTAGGVVLAVAIGGTIGLVYTRVLTRVFPAALQDPSDIQGALLILPAFQLALFAGLAFVLRERVAPLRWLACAAALVAGHAIVLALAPIARPLASPEVLALVWRGLALAVPAAAAAALVSSAPART